MLTAVARNSRLYSVHQWLLKRAQVKYATTAFKSKWKYEKLAVVAHVP